MGSSLWEEWGAAGILRVESLGSQDPWVSGGGGVS